MADQRDVLVLFDVDGTLTPSRLVIKPDMKEFILELKKKVVIGELGIAARALRLLFYVFAHHFS